MASNPRPPVAKNQLDLMDMLMQRGVKPQDRKAPTSVARFPTANTQYDLHQALASWNIDPGAREKYAQNVPVAPVEATQPKAEGPTGLMGGLLKIAGKVAANPVGKVVGKVLDTAILKPLLIADTGRRAVISGIREGVDAFDGDDTTKASWGDFAKQAKDFDTGFGNTFDLPGGKWSGRIIGFLGDVLLDPLTYATIGGTVAKKAIVKSLSAGGKDVLTRSILGKTMHGAKGRQALGDLAYDRLKHFQKIGTKLDGKKITDSMIGQITKDVTLQGKRKLPGLVADDIGLRGPGLYYFGSRVKVVGTEPIGWLLDKGLTGVRTGLVKPRSIKIGGQLRQVSPTAAIHAATVATGHGRVAQFGPDGIYHARMKLANGTATAAEAPYLLETVRAFEFSRGKVSGAIENAANMFENDVYKSGTEPFHKTVYSLLEGVRSRASATPEELAFVDRLRYAFNFLSDIADGEFKKVDSGWVKRHTNDYFPRIRTQAFNEWQEANPQLANQFKLQNLTVDQLDQYRLAKSAKGRQLDVGEPWFGSYLTAKDLNIDSLNAIARSKTGGIDVFETDIRVVTAAYSRRYGEHLGMASMMQHMKKRGPEFLAEWNKAIPSTLTGVTPHVGRPQGKLQNIKNNMAAQVKPKQKPKATPKPTVVSSQPAVKTKSKITVAAEAAKVQIDETRTMVDASVEGHKEFVSLVDEFTSELANDDGLGTAHVMFGATEKHLSDSVDTLVEQQALLDSMSDDALAHVNGQVDEQLARMATLLEAHRQNVAYAATRIADMEDVADVLPKPRNVVGTTMTRRNMDEPVKVVQQARVRSVKELQSLDDLELYLKRISPFGKKQGVGAFQLSMSQDAKDLRNFLGRLIVASDIASGRTRNLLTDSKSPMGQLFARQKAIDTDTVFGSFNAWMGFQDIIFRYKMENDIAKLRASAFFGGEHSAFYDLAFAHNSREILHDLYREQENVARQLRELPPDVFVSTGTVKTADSRNLERNLLASEVDKRIDLDDELLVELWSENGGFITPRMEELQKSLDFRKQWKLRLRKGLPDIEQDVERVLKSDYRKAYLDRYLEKIEKRIASFQNSDRIFGLDKDKPDYSLSMPTGPSAAEESAAQLTRASTPQGRLNVLKEKVALTKETNRLARQTAVADATKNFPPQVKAAFSKYRSTLVRRIGVLEKRGRKLQASARSAENIIFAIQKRVESMGEAYPAVNLTRVAVAEGVLTEQGTRVFISNPAVEFAEAVGYEDAEALAYINKVASMRSQHQKAFNEIRNLEQSQPERYYREAREIGLKYNEENIPFGTDGIIISAIRDEVARLDEQAVQQFREASNLSYKLENQLMSSFVDSPGGNQLINDWVFAKETTVPNISAEAEISRAMDVLDYAEIRRLVGHDAPPQQIIDELMDDDYYPFAKSIEMHFNIMHELSDFDMTKFVIPEGLPEQIDDFPIAWPGVWEDMLDDIKGSNNPPQSFTGAFLNWLKKPLTAKAILSPDDFVQFTGTGLSDEKLILIFGDWLYRTQPQILKPLDERDAARAIIRQGWGDSKARQLLNQIKVLEEEVFTAAKNRRSGRSLNLAESYLMDADTAAARRKQALVNMAPWTKKDESAFWNAQNSLYGSGVRLKESIRTVAEAKVSFAGDTRVTDASMVRIDVILDAAASGKLNLPGLMKMMAKRVRTPEPATVEQILPMIIRDLDGNIIDKATGDVLVKGQVAFDYDSLGVPLKAKGKGKKIVKVPQPVQEGVPDASDAGDLENMMLYGDMSGSFAGPLSTLDDSSMATVPDVETEVVSRGLAVPDQDVGGRFIAEDFTLPGGSEIVNDSGSAAEAVASGEMGTMTTRDLDLELIINYINGVENGTLDLLVKRNADIEHLVSVLNSPIETKSIKQLEYELKWIKGESKGVRGYIDRQGPVEFGGVQEDRGYALIDQSVERRLFEDNGFDPQGAINVREFQLRFLRGNRAISAKQIADRKKTIAVALAESGRAAKVEATAGASAAKQAAKEAARIKTFPLHVQKVLDVFSTMEETLNTLVLQNDDNAIYWGLVGDNFGSTTPILKVATDTQISDFEKIGIWLDRLVEQRAEFIRATAKTKVFDSEDYATFVESVNKLAGWAESIEDKLARQPGSFGRQAVTKARPDVADYGWSKELKAMYNVQGDLLPDYPEYSSRWSKPRPKTVESRNPFVPPADVIPEVLPHRFGPRDSGGMTLDLTAGTVAPVKQVGEVPIPIKSQRFFKGGFDNVGKGTPLGDGKDVAMRKVATHHLVELVSTTKPSSTLTTKNQLPALYGIGQKSHPKYKPRVIMLARNGELKGVPLRERTIKTIRAQHEVGGATFVVGDMPGVDEPFIRLLDEIGAEYTIYHTGDKSRISFVSDPIASLPDLRAPREVTPQQLADGGSFVPEKVIIQPAIDGTSVPTTVSKTRVGDVAGVDEVYIGRKFGGYDSSKWHNPYPVAKTKGATLAERTAAHQESVDAYRTYLLANPELLKDLPELRGKKLLCWCDPLPCHGNVLKELLEQADNAGGVLASDVVPVTAIPAPPIPMEATQVARGYSPIGMSTQPSVDDLVYTMAQMKKVKPDLNPEQVRAFTDVYRILQEALDSGQPLSPDNRILLAHTNAALESLRLTVGMTPEAVDDALIKGAMSAIDNSMPPIAPEGFDPVTGEITDFSTFRGMDDEAISTLGPAPVAPVATPPRIGPPRPAGVPITPTPVRPVKARRPIVPSTRKPVGVTPTPMPTPRPGGPKGPPPPRVRGGTPAAAFGPGKIPPRTPRQVMAQGMIEMEGMFPNLWMNPVIHEMWENAASFEVPKYAKHLKDTIGQFTTFHKTYSTATPGFHVRNGLANMVQLLVAGVNPKNMSESTKIYYGWVLARRQGTSYGDYLATITNATQRQQASIARNALHLSGGGIFTESFHTTYKGGKLIDNPVTSKLLTLGRESDDYSRFVMGYDSAQKGYGSTPAAARIQRWFFDYEDISKLDMFMKEIVPFWLWTSRNLTLHLQNVWLDPRPYQVYNHFVRNFRADEGHPPPFVDEIGGWKLPFGNNLYATPDVNFNRVPQQVAEIKSGTRYLQNLNPVFRVPLEQALGRNLYNDKEMEGAQQRLVHILQGFVPPVKYADRLINTEGEQQQNALLSFLGSPIKQYGGG